MDEKHVIDLEQARKELEQSKQHLMGYENMSHNELMELAISNNVDLITDMRKVIEKTSKTVGVAIDLIEHNQERTTQAISMAGKIENDLMEQGIFVGSYNLDDID